MVVVVVGWWRMMDGGDITSPLHEFVLLPGTGLLTLRGGSRSAWGEADRQLSACLFHRTSIRRQVFCSMKNCQKRTT